MENKKYIMVGSPIITKEIFRSVLRPLDNFNLKPTGGFWASEYISNFGSISDWYNYLLDSDNIASYKNLNQSTIFTLKEDARILKIDNTSTVIELTKKYPSMHQNLSYYQEITDKNTTIDFEKISQEYDGVYLDFNRIQLKRETIIFDKWSVNTLLLFNLDCIKEYQTAPIIFNKNNFHSFPHIIPNTIGEPKKIEKESYAHSKISLFVEIVFQDLMNKYIKYTFEDYDKYLSIIVQNMHKTITLTKNEEKKHINQIQSLLQSKNMIVNPDIIPANIALNYITTYLINDENRIKSIPKSKIKKIKWYGF